MITAEEIKQRESELMEFNKVGGIPFYLHRFQPPNDWDLKWYGVPERRSLDASERLFLIHPKGQAGLIKLINCLKTIGWDKHIEAILTGGTKVERNQRGTHRPSPHSILKGSLEQNMWCTAIDIGAILWRHDKSQGSASHWTSYTANRSLIPRMAEIAGSEVNVVPAFDRSYVVFACILSQCFGTVLHDKCGGYTGVSHRDHFHCDQTRAIEFRYSNSQITLIQMALNLSGPIPSDLKVDGKLGSKTGKEWREWAERREIVWTHENEMWRKLMEIIPLRHGMIEDIHKPL